MNVLAQKLYKFNFLLWAISGASRAFSPKRAPNNKSNTSIFRPWVYMSIPLGEEDSSSIIVGHGAFWTKEQCQRYVEKILKLHNIKIDLIHCFVDLKQSCIQTFFLIDRKIWMSVKVQLQHHEEVKDHLTKAPQVHNARSGVKPKGKLDHLSQ